jgi:hypothetical protein
MVGPRQNRVTPFGEIIATPERGQFMGNRGCLHNDRGQIVRRQTTNRWIICVTDFKDRKRRLMRPGHYTELFFRDEVTALAAGHRPCAECQRERYREFLTLAGCSRAGELDDALATQRNGPLRGADLATLPQGTMVAKGEFAFLLWNDAWHLWSPSGYQAAPQPPADANVLTPDVTLNVLRKGYRPVVALSP